ncbi:uncharacterized protein LOC126266387 [Aethina tumida]|uniref:uncharacterized protein LOC126266387 n=1 Tax=Aethina tumida TaxID=116153 RepID=UPI00214879B1|nr:uncharacterized protein LOC126266387 [Aethina tumida]
MILYIWLLITLARITSGDIIAYDCQDQSTELTKVSLIDVKPCVDPKKNSFEEPKRIQLLQRRKYTSVHVYTCLVVVRQIVHHCGMFSHTSIVDGGFGKQVHLVGHENCIKAHRFRTLDLSGIGAGVLSQLLLNGTTEVSVTLRGSLNLRGECHGESFTIQGTTYKDVVVSAAVSITLNDYSTTVDVDRNEVHLKTGTVCPFIDEYCFDDVEGEAAYKNIPENVCSSYGVDVLYEGNATLLTVTQNPIDQYIIVNTQHRVFALKLLKKQDLCSEMAWQTEDNRVLVLFGDDNREFYYKPSENLSRNIDMLLQYLSKMLYLELAFLKSNSELVYESIIQRCRLREKVLKNRITLALQTPHAVGNLIKQSTGFISRVMGEVLYIAKCKPVIVEIRRTDKCYQELPVTYKNQSMFRTSLTHIMTSYGTEIDCQPLLPPNFFIDNRWIEITPRIQKTDPAFVLNPNEEKDVIEMSGISPISSHGIYTKEEMQTFQQTLLFPNEKKAITNTIARRIIGKQTSDSFYLPNVFTPQEFKNLARSAAEEVWGFLSWMGNIFSICGFCYTAFCVVIYITNVINNYLSLKKLTEDHPKRKKILLSSLWQNLAHKYLIQLSRTDQPVQPITLEEVIASAPKEEDIFLEKHHPAIPTNEPHVYPNLPGQPSKRLCNKIDCKEPRLCS